MDYTVQELARLAGVTPRTLRYYDQIGLLCPARSKAGYRRYGPAQVDALQQILFYRELGLGLGEIAALLSDPGYDRRAALRGHLKALAKRRDRLDRLIENVRRTIRKEEGELAMTDQEKFEGFKRELVEENERAYGAELRAAYGSGTVDRSNEKLLGMTPEDYRELRSVEEELRRGLAAAAAAGADPAGPEGAPGGAPPADARAHLAHLFKGGPPGPGGGVRCGRTLPGLLRPGAAGQRRVPAGRDSGGAGVNEGRGRAEHSARPRPLGR